MSLRQQVGEWLGGLWSDFWNVPPRRVLIAGIIVVCVLIEAAWRIGGALSPAMRHTYHAFSPLRVVGGLLVLLLLRRGLSR